MFIKTTLTSQFESMRCHKSLQFTFTFGALTAKLSNIKKKKVERNTTCVYQTMSIIDLKYS